VNVKGKTKPKPPDEQTARGASLAKAGRGTYERRNEAPADGKEREIAAARADLEAEHVSLPNPWLAQLVRVFTHGQEAHQRTQAEKEAFRRDLEMLRSLIARAKPATAKGKALKETFLRDFEGRNMPIGDVLAGEKPIPLLPEKVPNRGRPVDFGVARMIEGARADGWSWRVCAAAVFLDGANKRTSHSAIKKTYPAVVFLDEADKRTYSAIKKTFRDAVKRLARR
jgi:hypothetical protein